MTVDISTCCCLCWCWWIAKFKRHQGNTARNPRYHETLAPLYFLHSMKRTQPLPCLLFLPSRHVMQCVIPPPSPPTSLPPFVYEVTPPPPLPASKSNPPSSIHPIQLNQLDHQPNNITLLQVQPGILHPRGNQLVNDAPQPRHQHADARPPAQAQPPVDDEPAALRVELDAGAGKEEERVRVECYPPPTSAAVCTEKKGGNSRVKSRTNTLLVAILVKYDRNAAPPPKAWLSNMVLLGCTNTRPASSA